MVKYSCETCEKTFTQKGHFEKHMSRKRPCKKDNTIEVLVEQKVKEVLSKSNMIDDKKNESSTNQEIKLNQMDYTKKTREELIAICKEKNIKGYSSKKKDEILKLITETLYTDIVKVKHEVDTDKIKFVDICCGIGSFHMSFALKNKMQCVFACDIDKDVRETYKLNYGIEPAGDLYNVDISSIQPFDILCAGFPCQPFSNAGKHLGFEDTRGTLFFKIMEWIVYHNPKFVVLENVPAIKSHDSGKTLKRICDSISKVGYKVNTSIVKCSDYGIPQMRKRMLIIGVRDGLSNTDIMNFDRFKKTVSLSKYLDKQFDKDIAYTIRCGGRGSKIGNKHNWDSYIVNGKVYRLSIEDALLLQGFPKDFILCGSNVKKWHQIGNTIPTNFTDMIAQNIISELRHKDH
jgi:DNA (cytosine-5)-methyltransferase 1